MAADCTLQCVLCSSSTQSSWARAGRGKLIKINLHRITKATRKNGIQYWRNLGTRSSRGIYKRMNGFPCQLLFNDLCSPPPHALCKRACVTRTQRSARRELCTAPRSVFWLRHSCSGLRLYPTTYTRHYQDKPWLLGWPTAERPTISSSRSTVYVFHQLDLAL